MSCKIIAEIGINHNGSIDIAKKLIDVAVDAGADYAKFQKRTIEKVYTAEYLLQPRESPWGKTQRDQKEGLELSMEQYVELKDYCEKKGIDMMVSCWDTDSQIAISKLKLKANKIASPMIACKNLLNKVAQEMKYTYISTGMSCEAMIEDAVNIFREKGCPFELMHCVSTYPLKPENANLKRMATLKRKFMCDVGYSGHEVGLTISLIAVSLGATSLERHITLDRSMYGSDQSASIEAHGLKKLVRDIKLLKGCLGDGSIDSLPEEIEMAKKLRAHIVSIK